MCSSDLLVPPYRVEALGSPSTFLGRYTATRSARALSALAGDYGLRIVTSAASELTIPAATAIVPTLARVPGPAPIRVSPSTAPGTAGSP